MASKYLQKFPIPEGFPEVLHDLSREILREQPQDIIAFAAKYFRAKVEGHEFEWDEPNPRAPKPVDYPRVKNALRSPESSSSDKERPIKMKASRPSAGSAVTANAQLKEEVKRANEEAAGRTDSVQAPESERHSISQHEQSETNRSAASMHSAEGQAKSHVSDLVDHVQGSLVDPVSSEPVSADEPSGAAPSSLELAFVLGKDYDVKEKISHGGFMVFKKCLHKPTGEVRAVRIALKSKTSHHLLVEKHKRREIAVLSALDHPNILRVYDLLEDESRLYLIMEYCEGVELFDRILQFSQFGQVEAARVMFQLLSVICYCHSKKVIHRDLKPETIFLVGEPDSFNIKIADFGSSAFIKVSHESVGRFGGAYYIAPEVVHKCYNEKIDVWSAGILLYILLTGRPPYPGTSDAEVLKNIKENPFKIEDNSQGIPAEALELLRQMLEIDPATRISAEDALQNPWIQNRSQLESSHLSDTLASLKTFHSSNKLKDAVLTYLSVQATCHSEMKQLQEAFNALDSKGEGVISKEELIEQFSKKFSSEGARGNIDEILRAVGISPSGFVNYQAFIKACVDKQASVSLEHLESVFHIFDHDGNGSISSAEIREIVEELAEDDGGIWKKALAEVDANGDGAIELSEFKALMQRLS